MDVRRRSKRAHVCITSRPSTPDWFRTLPARRTPGPTVRCDPRPFPRRRAIGPPNNTLARPTGVRAAPRRAHLPLAPRRAPNGRPKVVGAYLRHVRRVYSDLSDDRRTLPPPTTDYTDIYYVCNYGTLKIQFNGV